MTSILDSMMRKPQAFIPESVAEYTALQLARKLGDADQVSKYVYLMDRHALPVIVEAFNKAQARLLSGEVTAAVAFEEELLALTTKDHKDEF